MRESGEYHRNVEATLYPTERFIHLANKLLPSYEQASDQSPGNERVTSWVSNDEKTRYELSELIDEYDEKLYFLEAYFDHDTDYPQMAIQYCLGPMTDNQIRMLDSNGDIVDHERQNHVAANDALGILMAAHPEEAERNLNRHIDRDFWELAGAFILSEEDVEKQLDEVGKQRQSYERVKGTREAIEKALSAFRLLTLRASWHDENEAAITIRSNDYEKQFRNITEESVDAVIASSNRLYSRQSYRKK